MNFTEELTVFPSYVHKSIYAAARDLTPTNKSLENMTDKDLKQSCEDFHSFLLELFSDMYDHSEAYSPYTLMLEKFLNGRKVNAAKRKQPREAQKIIAYTRNVVHGYMLLICMLGFEGHLDDNALTVSAEALRKIEKAVSTSVNPIALEKRLGALARVGFCFDGTSFCSKKYPLMFKAMCALASCTGGKYSGFPFFAFCNAEFRVLLTSYKPTYEDYFRPLVKDRLTFVNALNELALKHKCKPTISTFWKIDYKYKSTQLMCIDDLEGDLKIHVLGSYRWENHQLIQDFLESETVEEQKYSLRHLWRCVGCSPTHTGYAIKVLGKSQKICGAGLLGFEWLNPTDADLSKIEKYIEYRIKVIDYIKAQKA